MEKIKTGVVGLGLIGSSICLALRERMGIFPVGVECDRNTADKALKLGIVSDIVSLKEAAENCRFIILAVPVGKILELIEELSAVMCPGSYLTDVGSTKAQIVGKADSILPEGINFIGGHPMAGSEKSGPDGARSDLFEKAPYVLTPTKRTNKKTVEFIKRFVEGIGAKPFYMSPEEHDEYIALISHVPHVIASALVNSVYDNQKALELAAGGFKDMTRIAMSNPIIWKDICISNKDNIKKGLNSIKVLIEKFEKSLDEVDEKKIMDFFERASQTRGKII